MTRLEALEEKTKELQGYLNQLQDAVTIGMFQLRDLKVSLMFYWRPLASRDR